MPVLVPGRDYRSASTESLQDAIVRYYDECYWDYRTSWLDGGNLAIHYGYWDDNTRSHSEALLNMNRYLAVTAGIESGLWILDAGCGIGGSSVWLAQEFGARVTGISLSTEQIEHARRNAAKRGLSDRADFQVADFCRTPFEDKSFDIVWGIESICHALDKGAFVREAHRLLRPGGRLVCSDGYALKRDFTEQEWRTIRICLDGWQIPNLATPDEFRSYLEEAGFGDIRFVDITAHIIPSARRLRTTALLTYPMQKLMRWLKLRTRAQTGNFYTALNQFHIFSKGMGCYGAFCATK